MKRFLCLLLIVAVALTLTGCLQFNNSQCALYEMLAAENELMPSLDELGDYESAKTLYHRQGGMLFYGEAYNLVVKYSQDSYHEIKSSIEKKYVFEEDSLINYCFDYSARVEVPVFVSPSCHLGSYYVRMLDQESSSDWSMVFPKEVYYIGLNDSAYTVIYTCFKDPDLDGGVSFLEEFLLDECGWAVLFRKGWL